MIEVEAISGDGSARTDKPWIAAEHVVALLLCEVLPHDRHGLIVATRIVLTRGDDILTLEPRDRLVRRINAELPPIGGAR